MLVPEEGLPPVSEPHSPNIEEIDGQVLRLFALVGEGLAAATESFRPETGKRRVRWRRATS